VNGSRNKKSHADATKLQVDVVGLDLTALIDTRQVVDLADENVPSCVLLLETSRNCHNAPLWLS
jgi:hypothetical protein